MNCGPAVSRVGGVRSGAGEWRSPCVRYGSSATCHVWRTPTDSRTPSECCSCLHRSCVPHANGYVVDMQNCRSCDVEYVYWCPRLSASLPFLIALLFYFFFRLFVFPSVAVSSISLVMCWNRETFSGSVWTVSLLSRITACIDFNDRQYTVMEWGTENTVRAFPVIDPD